MSSHLSARPGRGTVGALILSGAAALGVLQFWKPTANASTVPFAHLSAAISRPAPSASATPDAFGRSGELKVRFAMPGQITEFPLAIAGVFDSLEYQWVSLADSVDIGEPRPLTAALVAPKEPGFYHLVIRHGDERRVVDEPTLAVIVPFERKLGQWLNGYRLGYYVSERIGGDHEAPVGFVEVQPGMLDLPVSRHLKLGDFVTHDEQVNVWPKYVALNPRLLDKLELVFADVEARGNREIFVDVHSGFRAPAHNRTVRHAARDSRHQYGDAADIQVDADHDGRITIHDELLVMLAVERVEDAHPDLVGGMGVYASRRHRTPYLHIDTRGKRTRWRG